MQLDDLMQLGAQVFKDSPLSGGAGSNLDTGSLITALSGVLGGEGGLDIKALVERFGNGGFTEVVQSWLGDGANQQIDPSQLEQVLGPETISAFAEKLGLNQAEAAGGLSEALPHMVDKASTGGSLLESIGGIEGAMNLAGKFFGR